MSVRASDEYDKQSNQGVATSGQTPKDIETRKLIDELPGQ